MRCCAASGSVELLLLAYVFLPQRSQREIRKEHGEFGAGDWEKGTRD